VVGWWVFLLREYCRSDPCRRLRPPSRVPTEERRDLPSGAEGATGEDYGNSTSGAVALAQRTTPLPIGSRRWRETDGRDGFATPWVAHSRCQKTRRERRAGSRRTMRACVLRPHPSYRSAKRQRMLGPLRGGGRLALGTIRSREFAVRPRIRTSGPCEMRRKKFGRTGHVVLQFVQRPCEAFLPHWKDLELIGIPAQRELPRPAPVAMAYLDRQQRRGAPPRRNKACVTGGLGHGRGIFGSAFRPGIRIKVGRRGKRRIGNAARPHLLAPLGMVTLLPRGRVRGTGN